MTREGHVSGKRILFAVTSPLTLSLLLEPIMEAMVVDGWDVHVAVAPGDFQVGGDAAKARIHVIDTTRTVDLRADMRALFKYVRLIRRLKPDVVVGSTPKAGLLSMVAAWMTRVPVRILQMRGAVWDGKQGGQADLLRRMDALAAYCASDVIAVSASLADLLVQAGVCRRRPLVIGVGGSKGVDTTLYVPRNDREGKKDPTIGFVGRLSKDKGVQDALDCMALVWERYPGARLLIAGRLDEAQPIGAETLARLGDERVEWDGFSDAPEELYVQMDLLLFPSSREGLPNAVIEAAACAVPTVAYDVTGVRDAVIDGVTGVLVPYGDVAALFAAAREILEHSGPDMGAAARAYVVESFDTQVVVGGMVEYINSQLAPDGP